MSTQTQPSISLQRGFTLIEVMVVITIISLFTVMTVVSLNSVFERRSRGVPERLEIWLTELQTVARVEGTPYGVLQHNQSLLPLVHYKNLWFVNPQQKAFPLPQGVKMAWEIQGQPFTQPTFEDETLLQPVFLISSDGTFEPEGKLVMKFVDSENYYQLAWNAALGLEVSTLDSSSL